MFPLWRKGDRPDLIREESPDSRRQETPRKRGPERAGAPLRKEMETQVELTTCESNRDEF